MTNKNKNKEKEKKYIVVNCIGHGKGTCKIIRKIKGREGITIWGQQDTNNLIGGSQLHYNLI